MKTYVSLGIGDLFFLDSILTKEEKESISELYWACRFGYVMQKLMHNNPSYPNLKEQHIIDDKIGQIHMADLDPIAVPFWHFRPDFHPNFEVGLKLFGIQEEWDKQNLQTIDAPSMFMDDTRPFTESSFVKHRKESDEKYILVHYPTSTRPRKDIAIITDDDIKFVNDLSKETGYKVIVISDHEVNPALDNVEILINPDIIDVKDLAANCNYYAGCDSFCSILASKHLPKENIFIKLSPNFTGWNNWLYRAFLPHAPHEVEQFYKSYIGR
tara:strand:+ start:509 stop:1318 length:810 start_codon:yes stop_codon:yes gene_type:complete